MRMARRSPGGPAPRLPAWALVAVAVVSLLVVAVTQLAGRGGGSSDVVHERLPPGPSPPPPLPAPPPSPGPAPRVEAHDRLDVSGIGDADERATLVEIVRAIDRGGPFAYRKDGTIFQNREKRLPVHPRGHWREYTVPTPGERDRGARRIVAGRDGELFYTRDHYRTFRRIRGPTR